MNTSRVIATVAISGLLLGACQNATGPGQSKSVRFEPPSMAFAVRLDIAAPITEDDAKRIAEEAAGGTAFSVAQETEKGELLYEVGVDTASGRKQVEVRASDGAVAGIEADAGKG